MAVIHPMINKSTYNLGAFDTVTQGTDYDVVTRKTGYISNTTLLGFVWREWEDGKYYARGDNNIPSYAPTTINNINYTNATNVWFSNNSIAFQTVSGTYGLFIRNDNITTVDNFVAWLSNVGLSIQYELDTSYTEKVIKNQPLNTLDQQGSQWIREEWEKTLNLFDGNFSAGHIIFVPSVSGKYTISNPQTLSQIDCYNQTTSSYVSRTANVSQITVNLVAGNSYLFDASDGSWSAFSRVSWVMLNEGDHAYPCVPYDNFNGFLKDEYNKTLNLLPNSSGISGTNNTLYSQSGLSIPAGTYTVNVSGGSYAGAYAVSCTYSDGTSTSNIVAGDVGSPLTFTTAKTITYLHIYFNDTVSNVNIMLNKGSVNLPYQPYYGPIMHGYYNTIKDTDGHERFLVGGGTVPSTSSSYVTSIIDNSWTLSGSLLTFVVRGRFASNTTIPIYTTVSMFDLPSWIAQKIKSVDGNVGVGGNIAHGTIELTDNYVGSQGTLDGYWFKSDSSTIALSLRSVATTPNITYCFFRAELNLIIK